MARCSVGLLRDELRVSAFTFHNSPLSLPLHLDFILNLSSQLLRFTLYSQIIQPISLDFSPPLHDFLCPSSLNILQMRKRHLLRWGI